MSNIIEEINAEQMQREIPKFAPGDIVTVNVKVSQSSR